MSELKYCQGTHCHTYFTKDRLKGIKGSKTYQTRRRSQMYYGKGNFCDRRCMEDWIDKNIEQALNHFGRTTEAKHLTEQNAWVKTYNWNSNDDRVYIYHNKITSENRAITLEQYQDHNYTINE
jgi:hypothetical protein